MVVDNPRKRMGGGADDDKNRTPVCVSRMNNSDRAALRHRLGSAKGRAIGARSCDKAARGITGSSETAGTTRLTYGVFESLRLTEPHQNQQPTRLQR